MNDRMLSVLRLILEMPLSSQLIYSALKETAYVLAASYNTLNNKQLQPLMINHYKADSYLFDLRSACNLELMHTASVSITTLFILSFHSEY